MKAPSVPLDTLFPQLKWVARASFVISLVAATCAYYRLAPPLLVLLVGNAAFYGGRVVLAIKAYHRQPAQNKTAPNATWPEVRLQVLVYLVGIALCCTVAYLFNFFIFVPGLAGRVQRITSFL